jgi:CRP-like cAMP-binding protein
MIIKPGDFLRGLSKDFVNNLTGISVRESYEQGDFLFGEADDARYFYILVTGRVRLSIGSTGRVVHTVSDMGEAFGWSSLVGRNVYSASAQCMEPTELFKIDREKFEKIVEEDPTNGTVFYKHLAGTIGERLTSNYNTLIGQSINDHSAHGDSETLQQMTRESTEEV